MTETRTLLLMRHAEAGAGILGTDRDRDLTPRGETQAKAAGEWFGANGPIDLTLVSNSRRTLRTRDGLLLGGANLGRVEEREDLYEAALRDLLEAVQTVPDDVRTLLVVGHSPGIPGLAMTLANDPAHPYPTVRLPKGFAPATIVRLVVDRPWHAVEPGQADIVEVVEPHS